MNDTLIPSKGWFSRLKEGLKRSSSRLTEGIENLITKRKLDEVTLEELEELLLTSDLGIKTTQRIIKTIRDNRFNQDIDELELRHILAHEIIETLKPVEGTHPLEHGLASARPYVVLVAGVNGAGKTTTIGKLAQRWKNKGIKIRIAAWDTFCAAAVEQLEVWAERADVAFTKAGPGADPAGLAFKAFEDAKEHHEDVLIIDTAGRLHNKENLMAEIEKISRVIKKIDPSSPHSTILVLDATVGQNAHAQLKLFKEKLDINGLVITKLDGTAKGGVIVGLSESFGIPIHYIGIGEKEDDLRIFSSSSFAHGLLGIEEKD